MVQSRPVLGEGRLFPVETYPPAINMAVDQAILESVDAGGPPTLRFYRWSEPTLSLGYFQAFADREQHPPSKRIAVVRRSTGGGAIIHHRELTYSLAVPLSRRQLGARMEFYRDVHQAFAETLCDLKYLTAAYEQVGGRLGDANSFLCFQRRTDVDLLFHGYKVLGSAQRRGKAAVLQHGSLLLKASEHAPELPGLLDLGAEAGDEASLLAQLTESVAAALARKLSVDWSVGELTEDERNRSKRVAQERFASSNWLLRR